jgi:hypothetical protein
MSPATFSPTLETSYVTGMIRRFHATETRFRSFFCTIVKRDSVRAGSPTTVRVVPPSALSTLTVGFGSSTTKDGRDENEKRDATYDAATRSDHDLTTSAR